jgi:hypothetical protein
LKLIAESSAGTPRTINNLCFNALLVAFEQRQKLIGAEIVKKVAGKLNLEALARVRQQNDRQDDRQDASPPLATAALDLSSTAQLACALAAALASEARSTHAQEEIDKAGAKAGVIVTGKLIDKVRCQSWNKNHEFRIEVSLRRDPSSGIAVADRHYCCNFYISEEEGAALLPGMPVRIRIEQE